MVPGTAAKRSGRASEVVRRVAKRNETAQLRAVVPGPLANRSNAKRNSPHAGQVVQTSTLVCYYCVFSPHLSMYSCAMSANSLVSGQNVPKRAGDAGTRLRRHPVSGTTVKRRAGPDPRPRAAKGRDGAPENTGDTRRRPLPGSTGAGCGTLLTAQTPFPQSRRRRPAPCNWRLPAGWDEWTACQSSIPSSCPSRHPGLMRTGPLSIRTHGAVPKVTGSGAPPGPRPCSTP